MKKSCHSQLAFPNDRRRGTGHPALAIPIREPRYTPRGSSPPALTGKYAAPIEFSTASAKSPATGAGRTRE